MKLSSTTKRNILFATMAILATFWGTHSIAQTPTTLGVGISTPVGTLHVHSATSLNPIPHEDPNIDQGRDFFPDNYETVFHLTNVNTGTTATDGLSVSQYNYDVTIRQFDEGNLSLLGYTGRGFTLTPDGSIGIGITVPAHSLHVLGDSYLQGEVTVHGNFKVFHTTEIGLGCKKLSIGNAMYEGLRFGTAYLGFNAQRTSNGWERTGDGYHNGGAVIWATITGDIYFANLPSTDGNNASGMTDLDIKSHASLWLRSDGVLTAKEIKVMLSGWPDYVFSNGFQLPTLAETETYIRQNGHLPGVPSAAEVEEEGLSVGEMNKILMQKVEELTLHLIELQKQIDELKSKERE